MRTITWTHENGNGVETTHELPAKRVVCDGCEGEGRRLHEAIGSHAYSREEFAESFDDEEAEEYFKGGAGRYGVECSECKGEKVIDVIDEDAAARTWRGRIVLAAYLKADEWEAAYARQCAHERKMGY